jgi:hypothetical protein
MAPALRFLGLGVVYAALFVAMHPTLWLQGRFLGWDAVREHWGDRVFPPAALLEGELPLWNPFEKGGYDFLGDPQTGVLYPPNWLSWTGIVAFGDGPWVVLFSSLLHFAVLAVGMHHLLEREGHAPWVRSFGATALLLSARFAKSKDSAALWPAVWLPWLYLAMRDAIERPGWRTGGRLGVFTAFALLAGHPPTGVRAILTLAPLGIFLLVTGLRAAPRLMPALGRLGLSLGNALFLTIALTLPMLIATAGWMPLTVRDGMSLHEVLRSSITAGEIAHVFAAHLFELNDLSLQYAGAAVGLAALFHLFAGRGAERWVLAGTALWMFLLSCGGNTPVLPFLVKYVPTFNLWRISEGYLFGATFLIVLLAARGVASVAGAGVSTVDLRRRRRAAALVVLFVAALLAGARPFAADLATSANAAIFFTLGGGALFALRWPAPRARWAAVALLFGVLLVDLGYQNRALYAIAQPRPNLKKDNAVLRLAGVREQYRLADDEYFQFRPGTRLEIRDLFGRYSTFVSRRYDGYWKKARSNVHLLRAGNVKWVSGGAAGKLKRSLKGKDALIARPGGAYEVPRPIPRIQWHPRVALVRNERDSLGAVATGRSPVVERESLDAKSLATISGLKGGGAPVPGKLLATERNRLVFELTAPAPGVVAVAEAWAPGWQARVDGTSTAVFPLDHLFRGILVDRGRHHVEMVYAPHGVRPALWGWLATWGVLAVVWLVGFRRRGLAGPASAEN